MSSSTASKVSVFDGMDDVQRNATLDLLQVVEERIVFKVRQRVQLSWPGDEPALRMEHVMAHLLTLVEGVLRLEHASQNGVYTSDSAQHRVLYSIIEDVLGHTRAVKPR